MFYEKTENEIKNSILKIIFIVLIDCIWIVGFYLVFKPLIVLALVYSLFSITMIYPRYSSLKLMKRLNLIYIRDKEEVLKILQTKIDALQYLIEAGNSHEMIREGVEKANRKSAKRNRKQYNLYLLLKEIVVKEIFVQVK